MLKYALEPLYAPEPLCDCLHQVVTPPLPTIEEYHIPQSSCHFLLCFVVHERPYFCVILLQTSTIFAYLGCCEILCISRTRTALLGDDQGIIEGARIALNPNTREMLFPHFSPLLRQCFLQLPRQNQSGSTFYLENAKESSLDCTKSSLINIQKS